MTDQPAPEWARSALRTEHVAGSVSIAVSHRTRAGLQRIPPVLLGLGEALVVGRPDRRLGGGAEFLAWPGDASDRTLPRQAVRIDLLLDHVRFTLADSFRGVGGRPPIVEAELDGRVLTRADLARAALDADAGDLGDRTVLALRRTTGAGERETVRFDVAVTYTLRAGLRTVPAAAGAARAAAGVLRERWWCRVEALQVGETFRAAASIAPGADRTAAELLARMGKPLGARPDRLIGAAVRSLFEANRGDDPMGWDAHLRVLDVAHLYTDEQLDPATDGAREYRGFGDPEAFFRLAERLAAAGVVPRG